MDKEKHYKSNFYYYFSKGLLVNVNDSLSLKMSFSISISTLAAKKKNYTVSAGVDKILISYTKVNF